MHIYIENDMRSMCLNLTSLIYYVTGENNNYIVPGENKQSNK